MLKKMLVIPLLCLSVVFFVKCTEDLLYPKHDSSLAAASAKSGGGGGGGHTEVAVNNLSFPVFALDGFGISPISGESFTEPYLGPYTGLTQAEIDYLEANGPWYAQKVDGNLWQAEIGSNSTQEVTFIDWGDVIESVNPKINRPFRLEVTLYVDISSSPMTGYTMALLANASSKDEIQGTNSTTYAGIWATIVSPKPSLIVQYLVDPDADISWDGTRWTGDGVNAPSASFGFAPELNVGGKYIYGASKGGWKPTVAGFYRITFFINEGSNISFTDNTEIGNYVGNVPMGLPSTEGDAAAIVDANNNLTYIDVEVVGGGGGGGGRGGRN